MRILICLASVHPERGGPSTAAVALARALARRGHFVQIVAHDDGLGTRVAIPEDEEEPVGGGAVRIKKFPLTSKLLQYSNSYRKFLKSEISKYDWVLINSHFLAHTYFASRYARNSGVSYALRPHGSFNEGDLKRKKLLKTSYLSTIERRTRRDALFVFCTSESEARQARIWFRCPIEVIPLGADHDAATPGPRENRNLVLYLGRIASKKRVDLVVDGFAKARRFNKSLLELVVAGAGSENDRSVVRAMLEKYDLDGAARIEGFVVGDEKNSLFARALVYVLPSDHENFGISAAEAMSAGVPVVITRGVSHSEYISAYKAGVVIDQSGSAVADAITLFETMPATEYDRYVHGAKQLVAEKYSWDLTAQNLERSFLEFGDRRLQE